MSSEPPRFIGDRYHIVRELGRGGMGVVYLARDLQLDIDVAIKFRSVTHSDGTLWLKREFRSVASLRHPHLVELYDLVAYERSCYFTMEYVRGIDPRRWVEGRGWSPAARVAYATPQTTRSARPLQDAHTASGVELDLHVADPRPPRPMPTVDMNRVRDVLAQLAEGVAFLHASGVIHRDIKPSNAVVAHGHVKLLDFGLALEQRRQAEDLARETRVVGTAAYLAPEYLDHLEVSPQMDLYALGVLGFELVTGAPPFGGTLHVLGKLHKSRSAPRASQVNPNVPPDVDEMIARMLSIDPSRRPSAAEVATALTGQQLSRKRVRLRQPVVGREAEMSRIFARIADGTAAARLVLVTGPAGAGKSDLIEEAVRRARRIARAGRTGLLDTLRRPDPRGSIAGLGPTAPPAWTAAGTQPPADDDELAVWIGRCDERERVPYRAFDLIVDDLALQLAGDTDIVHEVDHVAALCRAFPVLARLVDPLPDEPPAADPGVERERALTAMAQLFTHRLHATRGILVVDDLQWADADSLDLLALLVERVARPLTVVASWTSDATLAPPAAALLARLAGRADRIELPGRATGAVRPPHDDGPACSAPVHEGHEAARR